MEEVEITAHKISSYQMGQTRVVNIVNDEQIAALPANGLNNLLDILFNADIKSRGANDVQADVSLRGCTFEQVLILLNGVRLNNPQTGHHSLDIPVDINKISRIEIIKGSGARFYGANALCGVINIITDEPEKSTISAGISASTHNTYCGDFSISYAGKKNTHYLNLFYETSQGYTANTDYNIMKGFYSGSIRLKAGSVKFQTGYVDKSFGANKFYSLKYPEQFEKTKSLLTSLQFVSRGKVKWMPLVYWKRFHDRFELFRYDNTPPWYKNHNYHLTDVAGALLQVKFGSKLGKTSVNADYFFENINSNVLGDKLTDTLNDVMDKNGFFTRSASRHNISLSLEHICTIKKFEMVVGALVNFNNEFPWDFYPGIDVAYSIKPWIRWYLSANKSFRLPTFTDLYYQGPVNKGNSNLRPEKSYSVESGFKFLHRQFFGNVTGFYRYGKHLIDWVKHPDSTKWESDNITRLNTWGIELNAGYINSSAVKHFALTSIGFSYTFIDSYKNSGELISYYLMDYLKHKCNIQIGFKLYKKLGFSFAHTFELRNGKYIDVSDNQEKSFKPVNLNDLKLFWRPKSFDVFISCNNIFDVKYFDFIGLQMPGFNITVGLNYKLDYLKNRKNE